MSKYKSRIDKNKAKQRISLGEEMVSGTEQDVLTELRRVMKKVNIYIWCSKAQIKDYLDYFSDCNMELLAWHKTNPIPTCANSYLPDTEYLLFFREKGVKVYGEYKTKHKFYVTKINQADKKKYGHPTVKPVNIIENLIINSSQENDVVLDAYIGSGTTAVACINQNRNYIGFEINEKFYNTALQRVNECERSE